MTRVAIAGLGTIGRVLARALGHGMPGLTLACAAARDHAKAQAWLDAEAKQPFDLARGPLIRVKLARLDVTDHILSVVMHHATARSAAHATAKRIFGDHLNTAHTNFLTAANNAFAQGYLLAADRDTLIAQAVASNVCTHGASGQSCDPAAP